MFKNHWQKSSSFLWGVLICGLIFQNASYAKETTDPRSLNALHILEERAKTGNARAEYALGSRITEWKNTLFFMLLIFR